MTQNRIHWFRNDLRVRDNPALHAPCEGQTLALYILDPAELAALGAASRVWLFHSLMALNAALKGHLHVLAGDPATLLGKLVQDHDVSTLTWTRRYDPAGIATDTALKAMLTQQGVSVSSHNGSLLWEPWQVHKPDGTPYRVFTPFFQRGCQSALPPRQPLPAPNLSLIAPSAAAALHESDLLPDHAWADKTIATWSPGEAGAMAQWQRFLEEGLRVYKEGRDFPALSATSRLAPHLRFGEVSPNQLWYGLNGTTLNGQHYRRELAWREFSYHLLYQHPNLPDTNLNSRFDSFPWRGSTSHLERWQRGQTGIPIVDAGMRELWQTGYMHNRVRMIVASFLVKNLMIDWRQGAAWFFDTLFDADLANNSASWQWVAGCGADAAPYFRIFNPVTQGSKFDSDGGYTRRFVPELAALPDKHLFAPWLAPQDILDRANITLGKTYPIPIVDLKESRESALAAFAALPKSC